MTSTPATIEYTIGYRDLAPLLQPDNTEGCGFLVGSDGVITAIWPVPSLTRSPTQYSVGRSQWRAAQVRASAAHLTIYGTVHTHPIGPDGPSAKDLAIARRLPRGEWRAVWDLRTGNLTIYDRDGCAYVDAIHPPPPDIV